MGAVGSCCSTQPSADTKDIIETSGPSSPTPADKDTGETWKPSEEQLAAFRRRLENKMGIVVLLADGINLACEFSLNTAMKAFKITCEDNVREIPLKDISALLNGRDQLRRIDTKANLIDDPKCLALYVVTGNCIPIRFESTQDKIMFIELYKRLKASNAA